MTAYIIKRLYGALPVIFLITIFSYIIILSAPGDPTDMMISPRTTPSERERIKSNLGLDKPVYIQYSIWLKNIVIKGDMGYSLINSRPVLENILERFPATLLLMLTAYLLSLIISVPVGIISAVKKGSVFDNVFTLFSFLGLSMPSFWIALMAIYFFGLKLGWFPTLGMSSLEGGCLFYGITDVLWHLVLPASILAFRNLADWTRYIRSSMINVLKMDYIRTAEAKGLSERYVIYRHGLKNAMLPLITLMGLTLPDILSGAYIIEYIFSWHGMGRLGIEAIFHRDYPMIMGNILFSSVLVIICNLIADIIYAWADPRIRYNVN